MGDNAINGNALAGLDNNDGTDCNLVGINLLEGSVCAFDVGVVGGNVHHACDRLTALAYGIGLEELAYLVEEHDGCALCHMRFGVGEEDHRERAERGNCHKKAFVKGFAATDVIERLFEHIVASNEEGNQEECEARIKGGALSQGIGENSQLIYRIDNCKDSERKEDAVQFMLL